MAFGPQPPFGLIEHGPGAGRPGSPPGGTPRSPAAWVSTARSTQVAASCRPCSNFDRPPSMVVLVYINNTNTNTYCGCSIFGDGKIEQAPPGSILAAGCQRFAQRGSCPPTRPDGPAVMALVSPVLSLTTALTAAHCAAIGTRAENTRKGFPTPTGQSSQAIAPVRILVPVGCLLFDI